MSGSSRWLHIGDPHVDEARKMTVPADGDRDTIRISVGASDQRPCRPMPITPRLDIHAAGASTRHGIDGTRP